jgi:hypothetical protein
MPQHDFSELYEHYPEIIDLMPETFTSHEFILKLAHHYQRLYIEALYAYRDSEHRGAPAPFRTVHGILAKQLNQYPHLITRDPPDQDVKSDDIFDQPSQCAQWRRQNQ